MKDTPLNQLREGKLPRMVKWYDPRLLARVGIRTMVSSVFGQYADQRIVQAATDPASIPQLKTRYDYSDPASPDLHRRLPVDEQGAVWVDYIADLGDGFESTYTMAYLLAQDKLAVSADGKTARDIKAGDLLIMGGDQCYPQATREDYKRKLVTPYSWAFDVPEPRRKLFAIPGNHDWYDGLAAFDSLFCSSRDPLNEAQARGTRLGGWQCHQHRSYWAMKLPYNWWIWGTDIQFSKYLDGSQVSYFEMMAGEMKPNDNLIICMAEPAWMLTDFQGQDEEENFYKITTIARKAGVRIRVIVAGDWHHYSRYYSPEHDVQFITAGGGGSFLHPTHVLKDQIKVEWPEQDAQQSPPGEILGPPVPGNWHKSTTDIRLGNKSAAKPTPVGDAVKVAKQVGAVIEEAVKPIEGVLNRRKAKPRILKPTAPKVYPEKSRSLLLSLGNILFPFYNIPFAIGIGLIYWLITWEFYSVVERHDISSGKIDAVGVHTNYADVLAYLPLYLIQALLVSIPIAMMLGALWACLTWYVEAGERTGIRRFLRKGIIGTSHFAVHVFAMFALGLACVMINNWIAPRVEPLVNSLWKSFGGEQSTVAGRVVKEVFEPLSEGRQAQREMFGQGQPGKAGQSRAAPPASAMPDGIAKPAEDNQLLTKAVRQVVGFALYPLEIIVFGGIIGGLVWGLYWTISSVFLRMHAEDAFAALRIKHYKNFLRLRFDQNGLTIYPVGVDRIPSKRFWVSRDSVKSVPSNNPVLVARRNIPVRLIETPIVVPSNE